MEKINKSEMIPFNVFPVPMIKKVSVNFYGLGIKLAKFFPYLKLELNQAELSYNEKEYSAIIIAMAVIYAIIGFVVATLFSIKMFPEIFIFTGIFGGILLGFFVMLQVAMYPKIKGKQKIREIETNLIFALRTMTVEIKSGVSLFNSLNIIAEGDYGALSTEFKKAVKEIETGTMEEVALEKIARYNPSLFFRRSIWQIINGMKAGADVSSVMQELVQTMIREEKLQITKYGNSMRLLSLMYMMLGVIIPSLGITFLIVLSSFPQMKLGELLFWVLLMFVIVGEFMYLGILKSKTPNLMG
ncbi:type II secretion system F family protein [Candidatus Micrarchaeota archaeon]|nr:type II secretion system F family protein [Candidatus Micrarchaeota archaeon]MBU2476898.1 type II secretion system F family protein [Candidatus Micrarchaeota archaeon]